MQQELVSIIMPSYNSTYIAESIDSVIAQSYQMWELIITDDCSTDNTREIIEKYVAQEPRIKLFKLNKNSGAGAARNNSIEMANGQFIAFLDSDDIWFPEKLKQQIEFMNSTNTALCYSSYIELDETSRQKRMIVAKKTLKFQDMVKNDYIGFLTLIYDVSKLGKVYMPLLRKRQDWALKLMLMQKIDKAFGVIEPLAYYRVRENSLSNAKLNLVKYNIKVYNEVLGYNIIKSWFILILIFLPHYFYKKRLIQLTNK